MAQMHLIPVDRLRDAVRYLVKGFGSDDREIELVTENLVQANLTGHDSHGVGILPRYAEAYLEGSLKPNAKIQTRMDNGSMIGLDGECGFGQAIGHQAMELGIARAKEHGSCILALGNLKNQLTTLIKLLIGNLTYAMIYNVMHVYFT